MAITIEVLVGRVEDIRAAVVVVFAMMGMRDVVVACVGVGMRVGISTWPSLVWLALAVEVVCFEVVVGGVEGVEGEEEVGGWTTSLEMPN